MPYYRGMWRPPRDAESHNGFQWNDDWPVDEMIQDIEAGEWEGIGISNIGELNTLFNTTDWQALTKQDQVAVLKEYQNFTDADNYERKVSDYSTWGLDLQRDIDYEIEYNEDGTVNASRWFQAFAGGTGGRDWAWEFISDVDWAHYNTDNAFAAARKDMRGAFGSAWNQKKAPYRSGTHVRQAQNIIDNWDEEEREQAYAWAENNRVSGFNPEDEISEDSTDTDDWIRSHKTMWFDTDHNVMHYYDHKTGADLGTPKIHLPAAPPQNLRIEIGEGPEPTFDDNGVRIANEGDITGWYKRYLNRAPDASGLQHWINKANSGEMSFQEIQRHIQYSPESRKGLDGVLGTADDPTDIGATYYNPQKYGSEESLTAKMKPAPAPIQAPTITIRNIGEPKKPTHWYNALPDEWLTKAPTVGAASTALSDVDSRHNRGDTGLDLGHVGKFTRRVFSDNTGGS